MKTVVSVVITGVFAFGLVACGDESSEPPTQMKIGPSHAARPGPGVIDADAERYRIEAEHAKVGRTGPPAHPGRAERECLHAVCAK